MIDGCVSCGKDGVSQFAKLVDDGLASTFYVLCRFVRGVILSGDLCEVV